MIDDVELVTRRSAPRQRWLAAVACVGALVTVLGLSGGPWAETTFRGEVGDDDRGARLELGMDPSGSVQVGDTEGDLVDDYEDTSRESARGVLRESVQRGTNELARVLAVLVAIVSFFGFLRELTPRSWVLMTAVSLSTLILVVTLRDRVISAMTTHSLALDLGVPNTEPTTWGALTVGGAAAAALAAGLAAGPRPVTRRTTAPRRAPETTTQEREQRISP